MGLRIFGRVAAVEHLFEKDPRHLQRRAQMQMQWLALHRPNVTGRLGDDTCRLGYCSDHS
jgi:hypothetical protein